MDGSNFTETTQADVIINHLKDQANKVLSAAGGSADLQSFNITSKGNLPYVWQSTRNLQFNTQTYDWIKSSLRPNTKPYQFNPGTDFTNVYLSLLQTIQYKLSSADQAKLNDATKNAQEQQLAVLNVWKQQMGSLPPGPNPIDQIGATITTEWCKPPTTMYELQHSTDPNKLLNNVPLSGQAVIPVFFNYMNALGDANALQSLVTENNSYKEAALDAAKKATEKNGGLLLSDNSYQPAYQANPSVSDILNALKNDKSKVELQMDVKRSSEEQFDVSISGGASLSIPVLSFFTMDVGGQANYFSSEIATSSNETSVKMTYTGVNLVNFGPVAFSQSAMQSWYWMDPVTQAIKNGVPAKDVTGFRFVTDNPPVSDFSVNGPFGYLAGACIANYPTVEVVVKSADYQRIEKTFQQSSSVHMSFLGIPLGIGGSESTYSHSVKTDSSASTVTITLTPPPNMVAGNADDSVGWILGAVPMFPASTA